VKIGFSALLWTTGVSSKDAKILKDLKKIGYDGVEVPIFAGKPKDFAKLGLMLDDIGLERTSITVIPRGKDPLSPDRKERAAAADHQKWVVDCSAAMGSAAIGGPLTQPLGHFTEKPPTDTERKRCRDVHRIVGDYAREHGVTLVIEAVNRFETYFANTMDDLGRYLDMVDHPNVKAMYDTFHANIEETDPIAAYTRNVRHVAYIHISENDRGVPGRGHVPWKETFKAIKKSGYDGWLTIESFGRGLPELAAATRVWRDFAESPEAVYRDGYKFIRKNWDAA
jgi:D-psicose/D-tagatose/L-ribulose 3-epimerase